MSAAAVVKYRRLAVGVRGVTEYAVTRISDGADLGIVAQRRGGWWRAYTTDGVSMASWSKTRGEAADALLAHAERIAR